VRSRHASGSFGKENHQETFPCRDPNRGQSRSRARTPILRITNIAEPRLDLYEPSAEKKNGAAIVIVPGGGFGILASGHEGADLAEWFRERGFVAGVLQHRCPTNKLPKPWEFPAQDCQRAVSLVRVKAAELGVKSDRVGVFGFSAGGQVALIAATNDEQRLYPVADDTDKTSCRPDFLMLCYAWRILAENSLTELKTEIHITAKTPPTFLAQANDDPASLAEGSTLAFLALRNAKVRRSCTSTAPAGTALVCVRTGRRRRAIGPVVRSCG
jgi:acetyl esterase/lipase